MNSQAYDGKASTREKIATFSDMRLFEPLPQGFYIRTLKIRSSNLDSDSDMRSYTLSIRAIEDIEPFIALSYRWTYKKSSSPIVINGQPVEVQTTVKRFLELHIEGQLYDEIFIDSLCINQDDSQERAAQVKMMAQIFASARKVYVWLGESTCCSDWALRRLKEGAQAGPWLRQPIWELVNLDYWSRTWVVQEFLVARNLEILCGSNILHLNVLHDFFTWLLEGNQMEMQKKFAHEFYISRVHRLLQQNQKKRRPLAKVLVENRYTACTDIRDKVYGLLGLCNDITKEHTLKVDYSSGMTAEDLWFHVVDFCKVHPDSLVGFCHLLRDSLRLVKPLSGRNKSTSQLKKLTRSWKVGVIQSPGEPLSNETLKSFRLTHAKSEILKKDISLPERSFEELMLQSATTIEKMRQQMEVPAQIDENRLLYLNQMQIAGASVSFPGDLSPNLINQLKNINSSLFCNSGPTKIQQYRYLNVINQQGDNKEQHYLSALSNTFLYSGDILCRFLGLDVSLVIRKLDDIYLPVGKAYLEDDHHCQFWQGNCLALFFDKPDKPHPMAPKGLEPIEFIMDYYTLYNLCW